MPRSGHIWRDRKSTRLNSSHANISNAASCWTNQTAPPPSATTSHLISHLIDAVRFFSVLRRPPRSPLFPYTTSSDLDPTEPPPRPGPLENQVAGHLEEEVANVKQAGPPTEDGRVHAQVGPHLE